MIIQHVKLHLPMTSQPLCLTPELVYMRRRAQHARVWVMVKLFFFFFPCIIIIMYFPSLATVGITSPFLCLNLCLFQLLMV